MSVTCKKIIPCCLLIAFPFVVKAQGEDLAWLKCTELTDGVARLSCFDKIANDKLKKTNQVRQISQNEVDEASLGDSVISVANNETETNIGPLKAEVKSVNGDVEPTFSIPDEIEIASSKPLVEYSYLSRLYDLDRNDKGGVLQMRSHRPNYIMPVWYNAKRNIAPGTPKQPYTRLYDNQMNSLEAKFQISFKTKLWEDVLGSRADLWFGYTQQSYWQLYNGKESHPFRNTDYEPEVFLTQPVSYDLPFNGKLRMVGAGLVHQSNGESDPKSRSWNRVYGMAGMEWGKLSVIPRVWWRPKPDRNKDDNSDITNYMGYGDLKLNYQFDRHHDLTSTFHYSPRHNKGGARVEYAFPVYKNLKGYIQYFEGFGENLLDYNHRSRSVGVGLMLYDWE